MILKSCPHCGGAGRLSQQSENYGHGSSGASYFVECAQCGCRSKPMADYGQTKDRCQELTAEAWNRRVDSVELQSRPVKEGCDRALAEGQHWAFCGESDFGSLPALCIECGGEYKLKSQQKGCGRKIHTPDPYSNGKCGFQYMPNESPQLCKECGGPFELAE